VNLSIGLATLPGIEVHQLSLCDQIREEAVIEYKNVVVHFMPIRPKMTSVSLFQLPHYIVQKKLKQLQPDIVHAHHTEIGSAYNAINSSFPTVIGVHNNLSFLRSVIHQHIPNYHLLNHFENKTLQWAKHITVDSHFMEHLIRPKTSAEIEVIPNCVSYEFFEFAGERNPREERTIIFLGKLRPEKGLPELIEAVKLLADHGISLQLKVIGNVNTDYGQYIREYATSFGLHESVFFLGWMEWDEAIQELIRSSALVVPSHYEPFGCSAVEGMALGVPVIASRVGGMIDSIQDTITGMLFESGSSRDLASKIQYVIENEDRSAAIGNRARLYAKQHFTPHIVASKHVELYNRILKTDETTH
jgi:glycosyltransferase involved in cell wall biosynthesis